MNSILFDRAAILPMILKFQPVGGEGIRDAVRLVQGLLPETEFLIKAEENIGIIAQRILRAASHNPFQNNPDKKVEEVAIQLLAQRIKDLDLCKMFSDLVILSEVRIPANQVLSLKGDDLAADAQAIRTWMAANPDWLNQITELDLTGSDLTTLPPEIELLKHLEDLWCGGNPIAFLPENLNLPRLRELYLLQTLIASLPQNLHLPMLKYLNLSCTPIDSLPEGLNFPRLESLNLSCTSITSLPAWARKRNLAVWGFPRKLNNHSSIQRFIIIAVIANGVITFFAACSLFYYLLKSSNK